LVGQDEFAKYVSFGASPRASINLILAARALAFIRGRGYALPEDVRDLALDVMRHRMVLSYEALADQVSADDIVNRLLDALPMPEVAMAQRGPAVVPESG
jgi:MoxR-like ATPase